MPGISIITATYNAQSVLPGLVASLRAQTDRDFEWVVIDGLSTDNTQEFLVAADDVVTYCESAADFGIYDALNKGVRAATGDYCLVLGASASAATCIDAIQGQAFNAGGGMASSLSLLELFALLEKWLGIRMAPHKLPPRERVSSMIEWVGSWVS